MQVKVRIRWFWVTIQSGLRIHCADRAKMCI